MHIALGSLLWQGPPRSAHRHGAGHALELAGRVVRADVGEVGAEVLEQCQAAANGYPARVGVVEMGGRDAEPGDHLITENQIRGSPAGTTGQRWGCGVAMACSPPEQ